MSTLQQYFKKPGKPVRAVQLNLPEVNLTYKQWGETQQAHSGDWLVNNESNTYTVAQESFRTTYKHLYGDWYRKVAPVWAETATTDGAITTKEGRSHYRAGDYLVYNLPDRRDGYTVPKQEFEQHYRPAGEITMSMSAEDYLQTRVDDQIDWYDRKSINNQRQFKRLQLVAIIFGATIPLLTAISFREWETLIRFVIALLGSAIAIVTGLVSLNRYQENWVKYRSCAEALRREKYHFLTRTGGYDDANTGLLVNRCEAIMASEQSEWMKAAMPQRTHSEQS